MFAIRPCTTKLNSWSPLKGARREVTSQKCLLVFINVSWNWYLPVPTTASEDLGYCSVGKVLVLGLVSSTYTEDQKFKGHLGLQTPIWH